MYFCIKKIDAKLFEAVHNKTITLNKLKCIARIVTNCNLCKFVISRCFMSHERFENISVNPTISENILIYYIPYLKFANNFY